MGLNLISTPSRTQDSVESGLSAANSQAPFEFQRAAFDDFTLIEDTVTFPGSVLISLSNTFGDVTSQFTDGIVIRLAQMVPSSTDGLYIVRQSAYVGADHTEVICYESYVISGIDGVLMFEARENYSVRIELMLPDNSAPISDIVFVYITAQDGYLFFDLGPTLTGIMDLLGSQHFAYSIRYSEVYDGVQQTPEVLASPLDGVRGRRQIGKTLGANMWNWILKPLTGGFLGRIFTDFHEPKIWLNNKRTLDILFDTLLSDRVTSTHDIIITFTGLDINKQAIGGATASITINPSVWFDVPQMYAIDVETTASTFYTTYDAQYVQINVLDEIAGPDLVNPLICKIIDPCLHNTIMLQWLNDVGGKEQWVFSYNQQVSEDVTVGDVIEFPITQDFSTVRKTKRRFIHEEIQRITMTAENLLENEIRALKYIKSSPNLEVELDDNFYNVVVIGSFTTEWDTQHSMHQFAVTIEMPVEFDWFEQVPI